MKEPIKVLFICHGNICRSPMAEFVMKKLVSDAGLSDRIYVESAATSTEELGNSVYPQTRKKLASVGISCDGKTARQMRKDDYDKFDYLIGMDSANIRNMNRIAGGDPDGKIYKLLTFAGRDQDVADPWYTRNFDITYDDILEGCTALLEQLPL